MVSDNLNHDNDSSDPINTDTTDTSLTLGDPSDADGDTALLCICFQTCPQSDEQK